jgi:hypothetical protein
MRIHSLTDDIAYTGMADLIYINFAIY